MRRRFVTDDRLVGAIGEPRHRRSFLYDLPAMTQTRLFHNNTVRTIAPEYEWLASADGTKLLIVSERDGDTVSPERGVYLVDLSKKVTRAEVRARVKAQLDAEQALRAKAQKMYAPIAAAVKQVVADASVERVYGYEKTLFDFDSKDVSQPGNKKAAAYLFDMYTSFGYAPEYQPFEYRARNGDTGPTANVVAVLKGTVNPELVYVISSHYDSVVIGPGADDDSSGTAALLETARILAGHPQPATIVFASFTGEEAGLLGSREFVRRAVADKLKLVGALNNDMIGWANDYRLDNTIRYSNPGIRDVQHAAAMQFTNMITLRRALLQRYGRGGLLRGLRRHRRRDRVVSGAQQSALPPVARLSRYDQSPARDGSRQDHGGEPDAAGIEPVAAEGPEGHELHRWRRHADVDAGPGERPHRLHRRVQDRRRSRKRSRFASRSRRRR